MSSQDYPDVTLPDTPPLPGKAESFSKGERFRDETLTDAAGLQHDLTELTKQKSAASERLYGGISHQLDEDEARMKRAYSHTGIEPETLRPWNEQEQSRKFQTDPVAAFGSLGSVFGIIASAFTHAPMENALNASAAAINAVKAGDDRAYERAHTAWKENTDLAMKRHEIMREQYHDAMTLMNSNLKAGEEKMKLLTARFGDKQLEYLAEHGMIKEMWEAIAARDRAAKGIIETGDVINQSDLQERVTKAALKSNENIKDPIQRAAQDLADFNRIHNIKDDKEQAALGQLAAEKKKKGEFLTYDDMLKVHKDFQRVYGYGAHGGAASTITNNRVINEDAKAHKEAMRAKHPEWDEDELDADRDNYVKKRLAATSPPSANKRDALKGLYDKSKLFDEVADKTEGLLAKHKALTGIGGKILRPAESVSNVLGGDSVAYHQFESNISELQDWWTQLERESMSSGRGLSAQEQRVGKIIRGLNLGDTTKVTVDRLRELKPLIAEMRGNFAKRGGFENEETPAKEETDGNASWKTAPLVNDKRSKLDDGGTLELSGASKKIIDDDQLPAKAKPTGYYGPTGSQSYFGGADSDKEGNYSEDVKRQNQLDAVVRGDSARLPLPRERPAAANKKKRIDQIVDMIDNEIDYWNGKSYSESDTGGETFKRQMLESLKKQRREWIQKTYGRQD